MDFQRLRAVWDARIGGTSGAKFVLLCLADHFNGTKDKAWPSLATIARETEMTRRTVMRHLSWLAAAGFIMVDARNGRSSEYWVNFQLIDRCKIVTGDKSSPVTKLLATGENLSPPPVTKLPGTGDKIAPDPLGIPQGIPKEPLGAVASSVAGAPDSTAEKLRRALCEHYGRPLTDVWKYIEERALADVARRPDALHEFEMITARWKTLSRKAQRDFVPQTIQNLLDKWNSEMDKLRRKQPEAKPNLFKLPCNTQPRT